MSNTFFQGGKFFSGEASPSLVTGLPRSESSALQNFVCSLPSQQES